MLGLLSLANVKLLALPLAILLDNLVHCFVSIYCNLLYKSVILSSVSLSSVLNVNPNSINTHMHMLLISGWSRQ